MIRPDFIGMDDRLWTPEEWAAWLRYVDGINRPSRDAEEWLENRRNKTAVLEQKDSRFVKNETKP